MADLPFSQLVDDPMAQGVTGPLQVGVNQPGGIEPLRLGITGGPQILQAGINTPSAVLDETTGNVASAPVPAPPPPSQPAIDYNEILGYQRTPGTSSSTRSVSRTDLDPKAMAAIQGQRDTAQRALQDDLGQREVDEMIYREEISDQIARSADIQNQAQAKQQQVANERKAKLAEHDQKISKLQEEYASGEIKPFWARKSTGSRIMGAIAIGLGASAQAMGGGPNPAMQIIQNAMAEDMEVQKSNLAKKREAIGDAKGARALAASAFDDEIAQNHAAMSLGLQSVANQVKLWEVKLQGTEAAKNAAKFRFDLEQASAAQKQAALEAQAARIVTNTSSSGGGAPQAITRGDVAGFAREINPETYVPAAGLNAPDATSARELRSMGRNSDQIRGKVRQLIKMREGGIDFEKDAEAQAIAGLLVPKINVFLEQGSVSEGDRANVETYLPADPRALLSYNGARLKALEKSLRDFEVAAYRGAGGRMVNPSAIKGTYYANQLRYGTDELTGQSATVAQEDARRPSDAALKAARGGK